VDATFEEALSTSRILEKLCEVGKTWRRKLCQRIFRIFWTYLLL